MRCCTTWSTELPPEAFVVTAAIMSAKKTTATTPVSIAPNVEMSSCRIKLGIAASVIQRPPLACCVGSTIFTLGSSSVERSPSNVILGGPFNASQ